MYLNNIYLPFMIEDTNKALLKNTSSAQLHECSKILFPYSTTRARGQMSEWLNRIAGIFCGYVQPMRDEVTL